MKSLKQEIEHRQMLPLINKLEEINYECTKQEFYDLLKEFICISMCVDARFAYQYSELKNKLDDTTKYKVSIITRYGTKRLLLRDPDTLKIII